MQSVLGLSPHHHIGGSLIVSVFRLSSEPGCTFNQLANSIISGPYRMPTHQPCHTLSLDSSDTFDRVTTSIVSGPYREPTYRAYDTLSTVACDSSPFAGSKLYFDTESPSNGRFSKNSNLATWHVACCLLSSTGVRPGPPTPQYSTSSPSLPLTLSVVDVRHSLQLASARCFSEVGTRGWA